MPDPGLPGVTRLRHCMVVDNYYPDVRVEREALALVRRGHEVVVICLRGEGEPARQLLDGVTVHRLPIRRQRGMAAGVQLVEYVAFLVAATAMVARLQLRRRFDVVQVHNVPDFHVFAALVPRLFGARVILDLHDLMPEFVASRFGRGMSSWPVRLVRWQERLSVAFAHHVLTVTDLWRDALVGRGVAAEKVSVLMNLPDEAVFSARPRRVSPDPDVTTLIYHGTLTWRYGIDLLIRAVALAALQIPVRLIIHGRGEALDDLRRVADEVQVGQLVRFSTERLPTPELPALIATADIGVVPYRRDAFTDGILPTKLMEYALLRVPAIVSRTRVIESYFDDDMVRYVEPGDVEALAAAIVELARDPGSRAGMAERASRFSERYTWPAAAASYVALVERLASRRRSSPANVPITTNQGEEVR